jgi:expansin (peptidoglycan-binding protein)
MRWYYEKVSLYHHSYAVLKTPVSEFEKLRFPELEYKYYVTENTGDGVVWTMFYDIKNATLV